MERSELFEWVKETYGTAPDYPWNDWNAVLRHAESKKWYAVQEAKIWETLIEKYAHAEEISEELADAMIESMQMNGDNSLSIQFRYMDSFQAVLDTVKILRKEVA